MGPLTAKTETEPAGGEVIEVMVAMAVADGVRAESWTTAVPNGQVVRGVYRECERCQRIGAVRLCCPHRIGAKVVAFSDGVDQVVTFWAE